VRAIATAEDDPRVMCGADGHRIFLGCDGSSGRGVPVTNLQLATCNIQHPTCNLHHPHCNMQHPPRSTQHYDSTLLRLQATRLQVCVPIALGLQPVDCPFVLDRLLRACEWIGLHRSVEHPQWCANQSKANSRIGSNRLDSTRLSTHFRILWPFHSL
jgi:hypothetical protein